MLEREVKLAFASPEAARAAVTALGAAPLRPRRLQDDVLLDGPDQALERRNCALRVRTEGDRSLLTFKGPVQPGAMKLRDELETGVTDGAILEQVLGELGFQVQFRCQKYREEYAAAGAVVAIDETPVGTFVEIEGSEQAIAVATRALGRSPDDFIVESYRSLFLKRRQALGLSGSDMVFVGQ